ncbi:PREDICTED: structure-specific endonuclease subunit slx1 [Fragaria vesca subsp. vesca]|uniref:structure-specific endonuclease subunit slx1 n=1 Tax=Fragaria vesca subsp. vesca TaxID=101020 RepID=UPI0002C31C6E|nr:PREDICTED: structure-specific endonuclease subunit slx1 [Fragaria vesca subsp. vesca]
MMTRLSTTFPSVKLTNPRPSSNLLSCSTSLPKIKSEATSNSPSKSKSRSWSVYLILSTNAPIKTYVGVTTDFSRRLKQHNGELKGGAKASRAGRPWICACLVHGFKDQNEVCSFESKWKTLSRSLPRKRKDDSEAEQANNLSLPLLQHRQAALNRVKGIFDCTDLEIDWKLNPL